jgi:hypothetical protein
VPETKTKSATINCLILNELTPKIPVGLCPTRMIEQAEVKIYLTV